MHMYKDMQIHSPTLQGSHATELLRRRDAMQAPQHREARRQASVEALSPKGPKRAPRFASRKTSSARRQPPSGSPQAHSQRQEYCCLSSTMYTIIHIHYVLYASIIVMIIHSGRSTAASARSRAARGASRTPRRPGTRRWRSACVRVSLSFSLSLSLSIYIYI